MLRTDDHPSRKNGQHPPTKANQRVSEITSTLPPNISGNDLPDGRVTLRCETRESSIELTVHLGVRADSIQSDTGIEFFNHMLEMVA